MKIYPVRPTHRLSVELYSVARKLGVRDIFAEQLSGRKAIIIADGSPDNIVIALLSRTLDHEDVADIIFPDYKHVSVLDQIPMYVLKGYEKIVIILDQEKYDLSELLKIISNKYGKYKLVLDRVIKFKITRGARSADIVICINGVDNFPTEKHSIEDHLLSIARDIGIKFELNASSSKEIWFNLDKDEQLSIFRYIINYRRKMSDYFKQQYKALSILKN